jgi:hypothetical protein
MFHLVKYTTNVIGWVKAPQEPGQSWFNKHELRIYQNLMVDFGHEHIFTVMLASRGQFYLIRILVILNFSQFKFTFFSNNVNIFFYHTYLPTNSEDIDVTIDDPPTDGLPDPIPKPMTDDYDIFQGDIISYSQLMSQMSIDPSVGTFNTQYEPPCMSSYHIPDSSTRVSETQPDEVEKHERTRRQTRSRDTYSPSLIKIMFSSQC